LASKRTLDKLHNWTERIEKSIEEKNVNGLPEECKWYLYWRDKLLKENTVYYAETEEASKKLISTAGLLLNDDNKKKMDEARKHRVGTKARQKDLFDFIYTYEHYIHPLLIETENIGVAQNTINEFNSEFIGDLESPAGRVEYFRSLTMVRYIECAREVMVSVDSDFFEQYMTQMQPEEPEREFYHERMLKIAEYNLGLDRVVPAAILTCEALIEFTHSLCRYYGVKKRIQNYYRTYLARQ